MLCLPGVFSGLHSQSLDWKVIIFSHLIPTQRHLRFKTPEGHGNPVDSFNVKGWRKAAGGARDCKPEKSGSHHCVSLERRSCRYQGLQRQHRKLR